jgi:hypothetical protein
VKQTPISSVKRYNERLKNRKEEKEGVISSLYNLPKKVLNLFPSLQRTEKRLRLRMKIQALLHLK